MLDGARDSLRALDGVLESLHEYKLALMEELFAVACSEWPGEKLASLLDPERGFASGPAVLTFAPEGVAVVTAESIETLRYRPEKSPFAKVDDAEKDEFGVAGAEIVMAMLGSHAGVSAIMPVFFPGAMLAPECARIVTDPALLDPFYACNFLHYLYRRVELPGQREGVISKEKLLHIEVPLPPLEEQKNIAERLLKISALMLKAEEACIGLDAVRNGFLT